MKRQMHRHWPPLAALSLLVCIALLASGCGSKPVEPPPPPVVEEVDYRTPVVGGRILEDGRKIGGSVKGALGEELTNSFFSFSIDRAELAAEYEGEKAVRGYTYLVAEITVINVLDKPLPMWSDDFLIQWGDGEMEYGYPIEKFAEGQMDDEFSIPVDGVVIRDMVFEVPNRDSSVEYTISYQEYYEDDVDGNTFYILFTLPED
ncbi:MAG: DUF4352 domain-containing protein [Clostridiales bacterium]|nr:DUF4352 domain-containing protein [Clostridiales bacterium]